MDSVKIPEAQLIL